MTTVATGQDLGLVMIATTLAPELRARRWATPGDMAEAFDRRTVQTPALDVIDRELVDVPKTVPSGSS